MSDRSLEALVAEAAAGDRESLEEVVTRLQQPIHRLAIRMLWHPEDAQDATQEILIRIITHLGSYRGDSRFLTWTYRIAANYLLTCRASRVESERYTFEQFGEELDAGLVRGPVDDEWPADRALLLEEVKVGCMLGMLTCLDRPSRLAYVLGEILDLEGPDAAAALGLTPAAFRKRLSRARAALVAFTREHCGLVRTDNKCRCVRRLPDALRRGRVHSDALLFAQADQAGRFPEILARVRALDELRRTAVLYRSHSEAALRVNMVERLREILDGATAR